MREDEIRIDALQVLEGVLHLGSVVGHVGVLEAQDDDLGRSCLREERLGAGPRLGLALALCAEHDPGHRDVGTAAHERQQGPTASDLDVVGVTADREHPAERRLAAAR